MACTAWVTWRGHCSPSCHPPSREAADGRDRDRRRHGRDQQRVPAYFAAAGRRHGSHAGQPRQRRRLDRLGPARLGHRRFAGRGAGRPRPAEHRARPPGGADRAQHGRQRDRLRLHGDGPCPARRRCRAGAGRGDVRRAARPQDPPGRGRGAAARAGGPGARRVRGGAADGRGPARREGLGDLLVRGGRAADRVRRQGGRHGGTGGAPPGCRRPVRRRRRVRAVGLPLLGRAGQAGRGPAHGADRLPGPGRARSRRSSAR